MGDKMTSLLFSNPEIAVLIKQMHALDEEISETWDEDDRAVLVKEFAVLEKAYCDLLDKELE